MLFLRGILVAAVRVGGGMKHGVFQPTENLLHIEIKDELGVYQVVKLPVHDLRHFAGKTGQTVNVPVRAWAPNAPVFFEYAHER